MRRIGRCNNWEFCLALVLGVGVLELFLWAGHADFQQLGVTIF